MREGIFRLNIIQIIFKTRWKSELLGKFITNDSVANDDIRHLPFDS